MKALIAGTAIVASLTLSLASPAGATQAGPAGPGPHTQVRFTPTRLAPGERQQLMKYAADTWKYFGAAVNPSTHLPMDNVGFDGAPQGPYTSPTDIGVYLWSVLSARDLGLISTGQEIKDIGATLGEVQHLEKWDGFLLSWYDTSTGQAITGPGGTPITTITGQFISTVDNGWYASGLVEVRQALPGFWREATTLLDAMQFGIFYDSGDESTNPNAGQMYGGYYANQGPATFEYGMLYSDPRIAAYVGMAQHQLPGDVWWRTWRTEPAQYGQRQTPQGSTVTVTDPLSGKQFSVFEGHYSYDGTDYVPSWGGDVFEGLMNDLIVPETQAAPYGFGANDVDYTEATIDYDTNGLGFGVWGLSPCSTPDNTGDYQAYGSWPLGTDASDTDYLQTTVTPHASFLALNVLPQQAWANIQTLLRDYPKIYGPYGFYDALDPSTGAIGPRYLDLDESMIMAALDDVLNDHILQQRWAHDPIGQTDIRYLQAERLSVAPEPGF